MIKKFLIAGVIIISAALCTSCGFHVRSSANLPPALKTITLKMPDIDSGFRADIVRLLTSLDTKLEPDAPIVLYISSFNFTHNQPAFVTTTQAVTYVYQMEMTFSILKGDQVLIPSKTLYASRNVIMNVNQVYTSSTAMLAKSELEREIVNLLYNQLISQDTREALAGVPYKK